MAELHILGQLLSVSGFEKHSNLFCRYSFQAGPNWTLISGYPESQTAAGKPDHNGFAIWSHPFDVHYVTKGIQGWPKLVFQVNCLDYIGRSWTVGYSCCSIPVVPGRQVVEVPCWVPAPTTLADKVRQYFLGGSHQLVHTDIVNLGTDRFKLKTQSNGTIKLQFDLILRNFNQFGVEYK